LLVTLCLVAWRRLFVAFGVYLAAELVTWALYEPGRAWVVLWVYPITDTLKVAAAIEAWAFVTWVMNFRERMDLLAASWGAALAAIWIAWWTWPIDTPISAMNQVRLSMHLGTASALLVAVLWLTVHRMRRWGLLHWHAVAMTVYLGLFSWAGLQVMKPGEADEWDDARMIFRCGLVLLLAIFSGQQFLQRSYSRPEFHHLITK